MRLASTLFRPLRFLRDLTIGWKLGLTVAGALVLLSGVSWFALNRLVVVGALQDGVAAESGAEREIQRGLTAALEMRVASRDLLNQQTVRTAKAVAARAAKQHDAGRLILTQARKRAADPLQRTILDEAIGRLDAVANLVQQESALRIDMLTARQKRLFQVQTVFENSLHTLVEEIADKGALAGGVASVCDASKQVTADQHDPTLEALNSYRLQMARMQSAALMFLATGNGAAANEVKDATAAADKSMAAILSGNAPDVVKNDAKMVDSIGKGIASAAVDLIDQTRKLDDMAEKDVETASQAMQQAFERVAQSYVARVHAASEQATASRSAAQKEMIVFIAGTAALMLVLGFIVTRTIAGPMQRMTRTVQAIAGGDTASEVGFAGWRGEIGRMAAALETLRGVMRKAFVQSQMIEQIPISVMTAEPDGAFRVTYMNSESHKVFELVAEHLAVPVAELLGQSIDIFHPDPARQRALVADPANLPHRERISIGTETLELTVTALHDSQNAYVGPMLIWHRLTGQVRLVAQFERSVGAIAETVGDSAGGMREAALAMTESAETVGQRTSSVANASEEASGHVAAVAAGAEELAMSVAEIGRQVAESARIAGQAVTEAQATDQCVGGLSEAAERIGNVVRLIGDIAARTNLLALNATIEAARAGEAGKGFAVVAGEVKTLATQTARATEEISTQIASMQQATGQAVGALRSIGATIERMNEIATTIASAVEEQSAATQEIARAVQQAAAGTSEVNGNMAAVSRAVEESGVQAGSVLEAATKLTEQSGALKEEVRGFLTAIQEAA